MADVTVDATAKGPSANSYITVVEGDTYHESHPYSSTWEDASAGEKARAVVTATRLLETWFDWPGTVTTLTQALLWPRQGVLKPGISDVEPQVVRNDWHEPFGVFLDRDVVPTIIKDATAEMARHLLASDRTADSDIETQGLRSLTAGPVSLTFGVAVAKPIPDAVMAMCCRLGRPRSRTGSGAIHMGRG